MSDLHMTVVQTGETLDVRPTRLVVAGYTGRDAEAVNEHIAELARIGVPPPTTVPAFYELDPELLTSDPVVDVTGHDTSGEVEPVIIRHQGRYFLGVGSDHTDRELEKVAIADAKAACPKPLGKSVIELPRGVSAYDWASVEANSLVDGEPYQHGLLGTLRTPADLLERLGALDGNGTGDLVLYGGTLPLLTGTFRFGRDWKLRLRISDRTVLEHSYSTR